MFVAFSFLGNSGSVITFGDFDVIMMTTDGNSIPSSDMPRLKIYFDGGCRPNPGQMETAVVARGSAYHRPDCGFGTSNDAEWLALIDAANVALSIGANDVVLLGDSAVVVGQANGTAKCRSASLRAHLDAFNDIKGLVEHIRVRRISRHQNLAGIALAKTHR
jgi:ribonuclease HI